ncbi:MAG: ATP-binding cassette domain-containing protein [Ardenticatenia bacterium]|nr:ATP-binding cassette domain-containing protein [Ardenticatenia bacterium]
MMRIIAHHLTKFYGQNQALREVSFSIGDGVTAILGPNGAGKTTLLNILATLVEPTSGWATIQGYDVRRQRRQVRRILGFLPQEFGLYERLTAWEFLDYMAVLKGLDHRREHVQWALEQVGLSAYVRRKVGTFSGGMRQRLGIAQALLGVPQVFLLDEPLTGLDPEERNRFRRFLTRLAFQRTVLLSTHLVEDVSLIADRVLVLHRGSICFDGTVEELRQPARGRTWFARMTQNVLEDLQQRYQVTHLERDGDEFLVRFLSLTVPPIEAEVVEPTLEESYLWLLHAQEEEE